MNQILEGLGLFAGTFAILELVYFLYPNKLPHIPGDIYINKLGLQIYLPFVSALSLAVLISIVRWYFI